MQTTLDELRVFIAVVDSGSITGAAERLAMTNSATSRTLARLEDKLDTTLIRRTTRRQELTEEGRLFLDQARRILTAMQEAQEMLTRRRHAPAGLLRVDAAAPFMLHVIVPMVRAYHQRYPQVQLELNSNDAVIDLLQKRTDVAIRIGPLKDSTLHATPIGSSRLRILASPGYLAEHGTPHSVTALLNHALLGFNQPDSLNDWPLQDEQGQPVHIQPVLCASSGETLRQLALNGAGIVCLSDFMTGRDRQRGELQAVLQPLTLTIRQPINAVYYRNSALSSRISSFIDELRRCLDGNDIDS
ncbi:LysR substrate-binding domain-containing protein [Acerihabitans sp. TG2]|uniref:LysR substrate-binding domain-containing protein n=1 Tax=Acerihabitans sp. TG2 TaxID=3096008 RepID=UPI002B227138|nr:LysR substrate-binding domain-containing protein [Acerihabitans sp. TG2]MEA9391893.1 LysR substrate-binding domain-containing protein [Acerihabitans sp. TG2]